MAEVIPFPHSLLAPAQVHLFVQQVSMLVRENTFQEVQSQGMGLVLRFEKLCITIENNQAVIQTALEREEQIQGYHALVEATVHALMRLRLHHHFYPDMEIEAEEQEEEE
jgi:hypothetical protein